jgi:hypothetical protein
VIGGIVLVAGIILFLATPQFRRLLRIPTDGCGSVVGPALVGVRLLSRCSSAASQWFDK